MKGLWNSVRGQQGSIKCQYREGVNDDGEVLNGDRMTSNSNEKALSDDKKR